MLFSKEMLGRQEEKRRKMKIERNEKNFYFRRSDSERIATGDRLFGMMSATV